MGTIAVGDINGDGNPDLVVHFNLTPNVNQALAVFLGNGDGSFSSPLAVNGASGIFVDLNLIDLDGDGIIDIVVLNENGVNVWVGNGDGTFQAPFIDGTIQLGTGFSSLADVNGDGKLDLVAGNGSYAASIMVRLGTGAGTFLDPQPYPGYGSYINFLAAADFNNHGRADVLELYGIGADLFTANSNGSLQSGVLSAIETLNGNLSGTGNLVGDFNGDGKLDFAYLSYAGPGVTVVLGNGDGTFPHSTFLPTTMSYRRLLAGDFNGDGRPDFAVTNLTGLDLFLGMTNPGLAITLYDGGTTVRPGTQPLFSTVVSNPAYVASTPGQVTVTETIPVGLTLTSISGSGWNCTTASTFTCTRSDSLIPGASYPAIVVNLFAPSTLSGVSVNSQVSVIYNSITTQASLITYINPAIPVLISPSDGQTGVPTTTTLSWKTAAGAEHYQVYFGTSSFPPFVGNTTSTSYKPGTLTAGTTYYWKIVGVNPSAESVAASASFTTSASGAASYAGNLDSGICTSISGWAADRNRLNQSISVSIYDGTTFLATIPANLSRSDVGASIGDNGLHGFSYTFATSLSVGTHNIHVYFETTSTDLGGSPKAPNCSAPVRSYTGYLDAAACSGISGWVADRNRLNTAITVTLWDGATQIASTTANAARADVGTVLGDNGNHGFSLQLPAAYANGVAHTLQLRYETSSTQLPSSPVTLTCGSSGVPSYAGYIDTAVCAGISGWAADRNRPGSAIVVTLWDGASQIAYTVANASRADVGAILGDSGNHGFTIQSPAAYADGTAHTLQVQYETSGLQLPGSPATVTCGSAAAGYKGYVEGTSCSGITGWAADGNHLNTPITVSLWRDASNIVTATANGNRPDVGAVLGDNGNHGFSLQLPSAFTNGTAHTFQVHFGSTATSISGSPVTLTCGPSGGGGTNYVGYIDTASCSGGINGWAADKYRLNVPITVSLWDGITQIASTLANAARSDVGAVLGDNGLHAFSLQLPSSYTDGNPHSLQVRFESSSTQLPGSPLMMTCSGGTSGTPNYAGYVDTKSCSGISGWAADKNRLNTPITVSLWEGATQLSSTTANGSRSDVGTVLGDNGLHAFVLQLPSAYANGVPHTLQVRYETSVTQLPNSVATLTCGSSSGQSNYAGWVDTVSCSAINGWAADKNSPNTSIEVTIYDGLTLLTTITAAGSRQDVGTLLGDNGLHAFSLATPASLKDGNAHTITVRPGNSATGLSGARTLACQ